MKYIKALSFTSLLATPLLGFAQTFDVQNGFNVGVFDTVLRIINVYLIPIVIALAILSFLYGLFRLVTAGGDEEQRKTAISTIIYGIIVLAVMFSVFALIRFVQGTFGVQQGNNPAGQTTPTVSSPRAS